MMIKALVAVTFGLAAFAMAPSAVAQPPAGAQCAPQSGQVISITVGDVDCVTASDIATQYDPAGDKYQQIGAFTCYSGTAITAPLLFTCVADSADSAEFAVYPA
jgi:hypothetical protein